MPRHTRKPESSFYSVWIILTTLCIPVAFFLDLVLLRLITRSVGDFIYVNGVRHITEDYLGVYVFIPVAALLTGLMQYVLLRRYLPRMGWWVLATAGGWLLGVLLVAIPGRLGWTDAFLKHISLIFLVMGFSIGLVQWLLLRRRLSRAVWWIVANLVGWGVLGLLTPGESVGQEALLTLGLLPACTTAAALAWLMKQVPEAEGQVL
jgi:hypothetical protein